MGWIIYKETGIHYSEKTCTPVCSCLFFQPPLVIFHLTDIDSWANQWNKQHAVYYVRQTYTTYTKNLLLQRSSKSWNVKIVMRYEYTKRTLLTRPGGNLFLHCPGRGHNSFHSLCFTLSCSPSHSEGEQVQCDCSKWLRGNGLWNKTAD